MNKENKKNEETKENTLPPNWLELIIADDDDGILETSPEALEIFNIQHI